LIIFCIFSTFFTYNPTEIRLLNSDIIFAPPASHFAHFRPPPDIDKHTLDTGCPAKRGSGNATTPASNQVKKSKENDSSTMETDDKTTSGRDADSNAVHCTAPNDRSDKANTSLEDPPAYVCQIYGRKTCEATFNPNVLLGEIDDVVFHYDEAGNWNDNWTTPKEQQQNAEILNENMGFNIDFSFLQQAEGHAANNGLVHLIADDASVASFGSNTGRPNGPPNNDGRTSASVSFSADNVEAAADTIGGGSTA
jgi:hypothetical protein